MIKNIIKAFGIELGEEAKVFWLLANSFFLGIFVATLDVSANALFLEKFGAEQIAIALSASGILGLLLASVFVALQSRMKFIQLAILNLLFITLVTAGVRFGINSSLSDTMVFILFMAVGPFNIMTILGFWGMASRMFNLRQAKRLFGLIDAGKVLAIIAACIAIPLIITKIPSTEDLLYISSISGIMGVLTLIVIAVKFFSSNQNLEEKDELEDKVVQESASYTILFKNKYMFLMVAFVSLSMLLAFFIHMSYLNVAKQKYPDEVELTNFLSFFLAIVMGITLLLKTVVYNRVVSTYGVKVGLLILPVLLAFFTIVSLLVGAIFGSTPESDTFVLFFLVISLVKLFAQGVKEAIEIPAFKVFYQAIDIKIRFDIQSKIDGVVNEIAAALSGAILFVLGLIPGMNQTYYSIIQFLFVIVWTYVVIKLYDEYRNTLKDSLKSHVGDEDETNKYSIETILENQLKKDNADLVLNTLKLFENIEPLLFEEKLLNCAENKNKNVKDFALEKIKSLQLNTNANASDKKELQKLSTSTKIEDRYIVAKKCIHFNEDWAFEILGDLLHDENAKVRLAAINSASVLQEATLVPRMIENLKYPKFSNATIHAISQMGDNAVIALGRAFKKTGQSSELMLKILNILGEIASEKSIALLVEKLEYRDENIVAETMKILSACKYKVSSAFVDKIITSIEQNVSNTSWLKAALDEIGEYKYSENLKQSIQNIIDNNNDLLYSLLALIYDEQSIALVRENIDKGTADSIGYAIELLDVFIAEELKQFVFPILDDIPTEDKLKKLQVLFPREPLSDVEVLLSLVNKDYNQIDRWTKACAMMCLANADNVNTVYKDITAQLFNSDTLLRETAAWFIYKKDPAFFERLSDRIDKDIYNVLIDTFSSDEILPLKFDKVLFLKEMKLFNGIPEIVLKQIVDDMQTLPLESGKVVEEGNMQGEYLYFIVKGSLEYVLNGNILFKAEEKDVLGDVFLLEDITIELSIIAKGSAEVLKIEKSNVYQLMYNYPQLAENIIVIFNKFYQTSLLSKL